MLSQGCYEQLKIHIKQNSNLQEDGITGGKDPKEPVP